MVDRLGQQLGNYRLIRLLGRGGFAEVYLGEHVRLSTYAAVKVLHTSLEDNDMEDFLREAQTVARLKHLHIVRVFDFDVEAHPPFLVMDYLPNGNVRRSHPKGTPLPLPTIISYVIQIASALQYAHDEKLIHRDIKPENMLLDRDNTLVLSDFGIATMAQSSRYQSTQEVAGTAAYMAPEQFQGKPRRASDQYALGVVVYEWLSGDRPFHGSFSEIASQHLFVPPPPLHEKVSTISPDVERVVLTALEKDPQKRFGSVQAFATALEQACQGVASTTIALPSESTRQNQPLPSTNVVTATSPVQSLQPTNIVTPPSELSQPTVAATPPLPLTISSPSTRESVPPGESQSPKRSISRRAVVWGLAGAATLAVAGGSIAWLTRTQKPLASSPSPRPTAHSGSTATVEPTAPTSSPTAASDPTPTQTLLSQMTLYVGTWFDHFTYGLRASDGSVLWRSQGGSHSDEAMALAGRTVYCGSDDHYLYALQSGDGSLLWRYQTGGVINSPPTVADGEVYIGSWDSFLYALRASDGSLTWRQQTGGEVHSSPAVVNGVVYFGSGDGNVYALHASDGSVLWRYQTSGGVYAWPIVVKGVVYIGSGDHNIYALHASDGSVLWRYQTGDVIYTTVTVADSVVYVCSGDHYMYALKTNDGTLLRRIQVGQQAGAQPAVVNGVIYSCSVDSYVYALRASDGSQLWRYQTAGFMGAKPVVVNGVVYAGGSSGLYALKASDGTFLWSFAGSVTAPVVGP